MEGKRFIRTIRLTNILSYGDKGEEVALEPLNVLIGPNASGKSNLIEAIGLLGAVPVDFAAAIRKGGGIDEWLWKGGRADSIAEIEATVDYPQGPMPLRYRICFARTGQTFELVDEAVENEHSLDNQAEPYFFYTYQSGNPVLNVRTSPRRALARRRIQRSLKRENLNPKQSVLSQLKDPDQYPELTYLGNQFAAIRLYTEWNLGHRTAPRMPQKADLPNDFLLEDASNLGLVLNHLELGGMRQLIIEKLKKFYEDVESFTVKVEGGTVQLFLHEKGLVQPIPATRLSDGMLRYLCLLTLLCHPEPPHLLCIEEPELGLHPDILSTVAELLVDASQRTQLVVTTHSDVLVSALTDVAEAVLVCERDDTGSHLTRLDGEKLKTWLEKYSLGELWRMGEIGGTRW